MGFETWLNALANWWPAPTAWTISALCIALAARGSRALEALAAPDPATLLEELRAFAAPLPADVDQFRHTCTAELNQRLGDVAFELGLLPARLTALSRICLASGTALALLSYIGSAPRTPLERVWASGVCVLGGLLGTALVLAIGRSAAARAARIREAWDRSSRETGKAWGVALALPGPVSRSRLAASGPEKT